MPSGSPQRRPLVLEHADQVPVRLGDGRAPGSGPLAAPANLGARRSAPARTAAAIGPARATGQTAGAVPTPPRRRRSHSWSTAWSPRSGLGSPDRRSAPRGLLDRVRVEGLVADVAREQAEHREERPDDDEDTDGAIRPMEELLSRGIAPVNHRPIWAIERCFISPAAVLIELDGVRLLTDPLLRRRVAHLRRALPWERSMPDVDVNIARTPRSPRLSVAPDAAGEPCGRPRGNCCRAWASSAPGAWTR